VCVILKNSYPQLINKTKAKYPEHFN
jgi:hypothetical protein